jgi:hypothetical protein
MQARYHLLVVTQIAPVIIDCGRELQALSRFARGFNLKGGCFHRPYRGRTIGLARQMASE